MSHFLWASAWVKNLFSLHMPIWPPHMQESKTSNEHIKAQKYIPCNSILAKSTCWSGRNEERFYDSARVLVKVSLVAGNPLEKRKKEYGIWCKNTEIAHRLKSRKCSQTYYELKPLLKKYSKLRWPLFTSFWVSCDWPDCDWPLASVLLPVVIMGFTPSPTVPWVLTRVDMIWEERKNHWHESIL